MKPYKTKDGAHPSIKINVLDGLPKDRFVLALRRVRDAIASGRPLGACDSRSDGNSCTWGLCHDSAETWPDAQGHTFPVDFEKHGRISHLRLSDKCRCPLDKREPDGTGASGCFYSCEVFGKKRGEPQITPERAIELYDLRLAQQEK